MYSGQGSYPSYPSSKPMLPSQWTVTWQLMLIISLFIHLLLCGAPLKPSFHLEAHNWRCSSQSSVAMIIRFKANWIVATKHVRWCWLVTSLHWGLAPFFANGIWDGWTAVLLASTTNRQETICEIMMTMRIKQTCCNPEDWKSLKTRPHQKALESKLPRNKNNARAMNTTMSWIGTTFHRMPPRRSGTLWSHPSGSHFGAKGC